jgi:hypothetical protein
MPVGYLDGPVTLNFTVVKTCWGGNCWISGNKTAEMIGFGGPMKEPQRSVNGVPNWPGGAIGPAITTPTPAMILGMVLTVAFGMIGFAFADTTSPEPGMFMMLMGAMFSWWVGLFPFWIPAVGIVGLCYYVSTKFGSMFGSHATGHEALFATNFIFIVLLSAVFSVFPVNSPGFLSSLNFLGGVNIVGVGGMNFPAGAILSYGSMAAVIITVVAGCMLLGAEVLGTGLHFDEPFKMAALILGLTCVGVVASFAMTYTACIPLIIQAMLIFPSLFMMIYSLVMDIGTWGH